MYIYDGADTNASQITGSPFTGTLGPGAFTSSTGAVTFRFYSDVATKNPGFLANYFCNYSGASLNENSPPSIYPNPTNNNLHIKGEGIEKIALFSQDGKCLISLNNSSSSSLLVDLASFSKGIYLLKVYSKKGIHQKKIIKN